MAISSLNRWVDPYYFEVVGLLILRGWDGFLAPKGLGEGGNGIGK